MKYIFYIALSVITLTSCNEYQKALKAEGEGAVAKKFKLGEAFYSEGKFDKANRLFAQIVPDYVGKPQAEKVMYLYSNSFYKMGDYYVSAYQFERFAKSYSKSEKLEEASFLSAKSYYHLSPVYTKDQKATKNALEKIQDFINLFPESKFIPEANELVKELDSKLEKKAFEIAKQYNRISDYPASVKSFNNFVFDFPGSSLKQEALFYRLDSAFKLAMNSRDLKRIVTGEVVQLKKQRLNEAKDFYANFKEDYANSKFITEVDKMGSIIVEELSNFTAKQSN